MGGGGEADRRKFLRKELPFQRTRFGDNGRNHGRILPITWGRHAALFGQNDAPGVHELRSEMAEDRW